MQEIINTIVSLFRAINRFKWLALLVILPISLIGWSFVYQLEEKYSARARVFVDSNRILGPLLQGITVQQDVNERVLLLSRTLLNRPNLEKLSRMSDLDVQATTSREKELLIDELSKDIRLTSTRRNTSVYNVTYSHSDPALAKRMVQSLLTIFVESAIGDEQEDTAVTQEFLDEQIVYYENRLVEADARLAQFKRENFGLMPEDRVKNEQKLETHKSALALAQQNLAVAESRLEVFRNQLARQPRTLVQSEQGVVTESTVDTQLEELQRELAVLSSRYTDKYPQVNQLRQRIETLQEQKEQLGTSRAAGGASFTRVSNPVYEQLQTDLTLSEIEAGALRRQVDDNRAAVEVLEAKLDSMPDVATELNTIVRGNESVRARYNAILDRRESARLSGQVEQNVDDVTFRVIDPPFVSSRAEGPGKTILSAAAFMVAIGAGFLSAFFMSQLLPVFYDPGTVASKTGRHVLGTVSLRRTGWMRFLKILNWFLILLISGLLLLVFLILEFYYLGLFSEARVDRLMSSPLGPLIDTVSASIAWVVDTVKSRLELL